MPHLLCQNLIKRHKRTAKSPTKSSADDTNALCAYLCDRLCKYTHTHTRRHKFMYAQDAAQRPWAACGNNSEGCSWVALNFQAFFFLIYFYYDYKQSKHFLIFFMLKLETIIWEEIIWIPLKVLYNLSTLQHSWTHSFVHFHPLLLSLSLGEQTI